MKIYIIGNTDINHLPGIKAMFQHAELHIRSYGHEAVSPLSLLQADHTIPFDKRMVLLDACEAVYLLPDWMNDPINRKETSHALIMEMRVFNEHNIKTA